MNSFLIYQQKKINLFSHLLKGILVPKLCPQSPRFRKLFSFTCRTPLFLKVTLQLFLRLCCWRRFWVNVLFMSTWMFTFEPITVRSSYIFWPQIKRPFFSRREFAVFEPFRIVLSGRKAWMPIYFLSLLIWADLRRGLSVKDCLPLK